MTPTKNALSPMKSPASPTKHATTERRHERRATCGRREIAGRSHLRLTHELVGKREIRVEVTARDDRRGCVVVVAGDARLDGQLVDRGLLDREERGDRCGVLLAREQAEHAWPRLVCVGAVDRCARRSGGIVLEARSARRIAEWIRDDAGARGGRDGSDEDHGGSHDGRLEQPSIQQNTPGNSEFLGPDGEPRSPPRGLNSP